MPSRRPSLWVCPLSPKSFPQGHVPLPSRPCVLQSLRMTPMCLLEKSPWRPLCLRSPCKMQWWPQGWTCCSSVLSPPTPRPKVSSRPRVRLRLREGGEILPSLPPTPVLGGNGREGVRGVGGEIIHSMGLARLLCHVCVCVCLCVLVGSQSLERGEGGPGLL